MTIIGQSILYQKIESQLRSAIEGGEFRPDCKLPNERELARRFEVSRTTIRQALDRLRQDRLVYNIPGRYGVFLSKEAIENKIEPSPQAHSSPKFLHLLDVCGRRYGAWDYFQLRTFQELAVQFGWRFCPHWVDSHEEARRLVLELNQDPTAIGGLINGKLTSQLAAELLQGVQFPWVKVGDFIDFDRHWPVTDQVIGDNYLISFRITQQAIEQGSRRPALLMYGMDHIWSKDILSGYRTVLDAAKIPPQDQQIIDVASYRDDPHQTPGTAEANDRTNRLAFYRIVESWRQQNRWPDTLILWSHPPEHLDDMVKQDAKLQKFIERMRIISLGLKQELDEMLSRRIFSFPMTYYAYPLDSAVRVALTFIQERRENPNRVHRRFYLPDVEKIEVPFASVTSDLASRQIVSSVL